MTSLGAFAVIFDQNGRVLLSHRRDVDHWNLPGGGVEPFELPTEAVIREVEEETGLVVTIDRLSGVYVKTYKDDLVFTFICHPCGGNLVSLTDESDDNRFFALDDLPESLFDKHLQRVRDAARNDPTPIFTRHLQNSSDVKEKP